MRTLLTMINLLGCFVLFGCGSSSKTEVPPLISGTVTFDGQPLNEADITLVSDVPDVAKAATIAGGRVSEGKFSFTCPPGKYKVKFEAKRPGKVVQGMGQTWDQYLPARYNDKTELTAEVLKEGNRPLEFALRK